MNAFVVNGLVKRPVPSWSAYRMAATRRPMVDGRMPRSTSLARKAAIVFGH
jgi:hypothetical protein